MSKGLEEVSDVLRNPHRHPNGDIDVEIDHPVHGWIPFTASENDPVEYGRELFALLDPIVPKLGE